MKLKVIKFKDGNYAVGQFNFFGYQGCRDRDNVKYLWTKDNHIRKWALYEMFWQAEDRMKELMRNKETSLRICKVFS